METLIMIDFDGKVIGAVDSFYIDENFDNTPHTLKCGRVRIDSKDSEFLEFFRFLKFQKEPIEIKLLTSKTLFVCKNCWANNLGAAMNSNNLFILEGFSFSFERLIKIQQTEISNICKI